MRLPFSPITLFLMIGAMGFIVVIIQIGALTIAFDKLGLSAFSALLLLGASLAGSAINLPLFTLNAAPQPQRHSYTPWRSVLRIPYREFTGKTLIAINVGGGVLPIAFSIYLLGHNPLSWVRLSWPRRSSRRSAARSADRYRDLGLECRSWSRR